MLGTRGPSVRLGHVTALYKAGVENTNCILHLSESSGICTNYARCPSLALACGSQPPPPSPWRFADTPPDRKMMKLEATTHDNRRVNLDSNPDSPKNSGAPRVPNSYAAHIFLVRQKACLESQFTWSRPRRQGRACQCRQGWSPWPWGSSCSSRRWRP